MLQEKIQINSYKELDEFIQKEENKYTFFRFYTSSLIRFLVLLFSLLFMLMGYVYQGSNIGITTNILAGLLFGHMFFWRSLHIGSYNDAPSLEKSISFFAIGFIMFYLLVLRQYVYLGEGLNCLALQFSGWFMSYLSFSIRADLTYGAENMSEYTMIEDTKENRQFFKRIRFYFLYLNKKAFWSGPVSLKKTGIDN